MHSLYSITSRKLSALEPGTLIVPSNVRRNRRLLLLSVLIGLIGVSASAIAAAELGEAAGRAYAEYVGQASRSTGPRTTGPRSNV